ncbi:hypothetical protein MMPV_000918 [Pyropia vietnamensis]
MSGGGVASPTSGIPPPVFVPSPPASRPPASAGPSSVTRIVDRGDGADDTSRHRVRISGVCLAPREAEVGWSATPLPPRRRKRPMGRPSDGDDRCRRRPSSRVDVRPSPERNDAAPGGGDGSRARRGGGERGDGGGGSSSGRGRAGSEAGAVVVAPAVAASPARGLDGIASGSRAGAPAASARTVAAPSIVAGEEGTGGAGATLPAEPSSGLLPAPGPTAGPTDDPAVVGSGGVAAASNGAPPRPCTIGSETTVSSSDGSGDTEDSDDSDDSDDEACLWQTTAVEGPSPVTPPADDDSPDGASVAVAAPVLVDDPDEEELIANGTASGATGGDGLGAVGVAGGGRGSAGTPSTAVGVLGPGRGGRRWTDLTDSQDTEASAATKRRRLWRAAGDEWEAGGLYGIVKEEEAEEEEDVDDGRDRDGPRPWIDVPIGGGTPRGAGVGGVGRGGSVAGSSASRATPPRRPSSAGATVAATPGSGGGGGSADDGSTGATPGSLKCTLCPATYGTAPSLNGHLRLAHPELLRFKCPYCPRRALTALGVHTHARVMHQTEPLPCRLCGLVPTEPTEAAHMAAAHAPTAPEGWLSCDACGDAFSTARGVRIHQSRVHRPLGPIPPGAAGGGDDAERAEGEEGGDGAANAAAEGGGAGDSKAGLRTAAGLSISHLRRRVAAAAARGGR